MTRKHEPTTSSWAQCWKSKETPWAHSEADDFLKTGKNLLRGAGLKRGQIAFVPLCGNAEAVAILHRWGCRVTALDAVPEALRRLRNDRFPGVRFRKTGASKGEVEYHAPDLRLIAGDIFGFQESDSVNLIYDRGALVALPPSTRVRYAKVLRGALRTGGLLMVVSFSYIGRRYDGPPHPITPKGVARLFRGCKVVCSKSVAVKEISSRWKEVGARRLQHHMTLLRG